MMALMKSGHFEWRATNRRQWEKLSHRRILEGADIALGK